MTWPTHLQINAWAGANISNRAALEPALNTRFLGQNTPVRSDTLAPTLPNLADWSDDRVGWGLVMPDDPHLPPAEKAKLRLTDPEPLHRLVQFRNDAPIFRYDPNGEPGTLLRYYPNGDIQKTAFQALQYGTKPGDLPKYLLIYGSPDDIPWTAQYDMQFSRFTGRLDLQGVALENYVNAIETDWAAAQPDPLAMTVWSVRHSVDDITELMHNSIAAQLLDRISQHAEYTPSGIDGAGADLDALTLSLQTTTPAFIATTSHGATEPLGDLDQLKSHLGALIDQNHTRLAPNDLLANWSPAGAIWYAHACCSAGSNQRSSFVDYVAGGSDVARILEGVEHCGSITAPLPHALLGATNPLRAFIGHVEPTFNWSLMHPDTKQYLTRPILDALFDRLYSGLPIGMALDSCRRASSALTGSYRIAKEELAQGIDKSADLLRLQLTARDLDSLVLLGDPAVALAQG